jgi:addiction module HigA family antidote
MAKQLQPITPGEVLLEEFLIPLNISQSSLSRDMNITLRRINEICHGKRAITPDTALRLSTYFGVSAEFWLMLQQRYELEILRDKEEAQLKKEIRPFSGILGDVSFKGI